MGLDWRCYLLLVLLALLGHGGADLAIPDERSGLPFSGDLLFYRRAY